MTKTHFKNQQSINSILQGYVVHINETNKNLDQKQDEWAHQAYLHEQEELDLQAQFYEQKLKEQDKKFANQLVVQKRQYDEKLTKLEVQSIPPLSLQDFVLKQEEGPAGIFPNPFFGKEIPLLTPCIL